MTKEQQRIAIAEACGVHICSGCNHQIDREVCWCGDYIRNHGYDDGHSPIPIGCTCGYADADKRRLDQPNTPNYLEDLNAMHEAEKTLSYEQRKQFIIQLIMAVGPSAREESPLDWENGWHEIHATASQRAEAFLRVLGLWNTENA